MIPSLPRLEDYEVSAAHGFLPTHFPCQRLRDAYYIPWESIIQNLQALVLTKQLRPVVNRLPLLGTGLLYDEGEWRRAYSILGFIVHAYVWGDTPCDRIPPQISIPFLTACDHLELPPVASYASTVLWNWKPLLASEPVDNLENIYTLNTFTGSLDESWFYLVSVAIEARGAPIIPLMLEAVAAARANDSELVIECLHGFAERLDELGSLLTRMYENCDPHVFYHRIRPYLAGFKNMRDAGLPNGVIFETGSLDDDYVQYSGGSNAQSSIIQFFDVILGIEHRPTGEGRAADHSNPSASDSEGSYRAPPLNFIAEMRKYMPGPHRRFLEHVERVANIREYVWARREDRALSIAYDACLAMLRAFRDKHIQMVSRYIVLKSRESRADGRSISPTSPYPTIKRVNLAVGSIAQGDSRKGGLKRLRGTGGTALIPFLKQARDETGEPAIDAWARRLLGNGPGPAEANRLYEEAIAKRGASGVRLTKMSEQASGEIEIVGLAGVWSIDDSEGGICHW